MILHLSVLFSSLALSFQPASSQVTAPDSQRLASRCENILNKSTRDSVDVALVISTYDFADEGRIPRELGTLLETGLLQYFSPPQPLTLGVFTDAEKSRPGTRGPVSRTLQGAYLLTITRTGHIARADVLGGTRDSDFDNAMLRAVISLDTSALLPPVMPKLDMDSAVVLVAVWPPGPDSSFRKLKTYRPVAPPTNFLSFKTAKLKLSVAPFTELGNPSPDYPNGARLLTREGNVSVQFVIDSTGSPDFGSLLVLSSTGPDFTRAVLDVLPRYHFRPAVIEGCVANMLVELPFHFRMRPLRQNN